MTMKSGFWQLNTRGFHCLFAGAGADGTSPLYFGKSVANEDSSSRPDGLSSFVNFGTDLRRQVS